MTTPQSVTLTTIGGGALPELFAAELARVLVNIADINTDPGQKRTITMTVDFKATSKRDTLETKIKCGSKLAGIMTVSTQLFMGKHKGQLIAVDVDPRQGGLFDQPPGPRAVSNFPTNGTGEGGDQ